MSIRIITLLAFSLLCANHLSAKEPLKVYILVGQSNMQGHADVSTLDHVGMDPKTAPLLKEMRNDDGTPRVHDNIWISSIGNGGSEEEYTGKLTTGFGAIGRSIKIGPELTFGIYMQKHVKQPILLIKTAWEVSRFTQIFGRPAAGPHEYSEEKLASLKERGKDVEQLKAERAAATGRYYKLMLDHINRVVGDIERVYPEYDAQAGYEFAGMVWFQGWNDMVAGDVYPNRSQPGGYDLYSEVMADFIRDVRKDLKSPQLPFVIGVLGVGGPTDKYGPNQQRYKSTHNAFRHAMAAPASLPEFQGNVAAVLTENYWDAELDELIERGRQLKTKSNELSNDKTLTRQQREAALDKFRSELYTPRELKVLEGRSNAAYHYNGSAKIMAQIGKGFAEAMAGMSK